MARAQRAIANGGTIARCRSAHALRPRWGTTELVLFSIPLEALASAPTAPGEVVRNLSPAERSVIELAARGYGNAEIAERRATKLLTTKKQLESAYRKLGVGSRAELVSLLARMQVPGTYSIDNSANDDEQKQDE